MRARTRPRAARSNGPASTMARVSPISAATSRFRSVVRSFMGAAPFDWVLGWCWRNDWRALRTLQAARRNPPCEVVAPRQNPVATDRNGVGDGIDAATKLETTQGRGLICEVAADLFGNRRGGRQRSGNCGNERQQSGRKLSGRARAGVGQIGSSLSIAVPARDAAHSGSPASRIASNRCSWSAWWRNAFHRPRWARLNSG